MTNIILLAKNECHICGKNVLPEEKIIEHNHLTVQYRDVAHNACNLKLCIKKESFKIPVIFHNGEHYDFHMGLFDKISKLFLIRIKFIYRLAGKIILFSKIRVIS